ncbi:unnamed protein product [Owenia fusiformis]|uniref:Uncharacterized protein n=1 Tax=Owenia fusiformis TaxID=6347 RepID=A0A8J1XRQ1_OWEFU|nr:unnamed protein product [Owenia fusiformis]
MDIFYLTLLLLISISTTESVFKDDCLSRHNELRVEHTDTPLMSYDDTIATQAQAYAQDLADRDAFEHSGVSGFGENLYIVSSSRSISGDHCRAATQAWYDEISLYDYDNHGFKSETGHFTQVIWKGTLQLGCGEVKYQSPNGQFKSVVVCQYKSPGNVKGRFPQNVLPLKPTAAVHYMTPHIGGLNGETRITIFGRGFAKNQFNFDKGNEHVGNSVTFVSQKTSYPCRIHKDGSNEKQIQCYTQAMPHGFYYVRVAIDGVMIPNSKLCNNRPNGYHCRFLTYKWHTPLIDRLTPRSGPPGTIVDMRTLMFTDRYGSNDEKSSNGKTTDIKRVYFGGQKCELRKRDNVTGELTDELHGLFLDDPDGDGVSTSDWGHLKCQMEGTYIGSINGSIIVGSHYGRSRTKTNLLHVTSNNKIAMFQTYAEVIGVTPSTGSLAGGTKITISGRNFDETNAPALAEISGVPCMVENVTDTEIVCITGSEPANFTLYSGNRGMYREIFNHALVQFGNLAQVLNYNASLAASIDWFDEGYWSENKRNGFNSRNRAYFVPTVDGEYMFYVKSDDPSRLYMSPNEDPSQKVEIAFSDRYRRYYNHASQKSERFTLKAGKKYYLEAVQYEGVGGEMVSIAVKMYKTTFMSHQSKDVHSELQEVTIHADFALEQQVVELKNWASQASINEVQIVTVKSLVGAIRLGMDGIYTGFVDIGSDDCASVIETELNKLTTISPDSVSVSVTSIDRKVFDITFNSQRGDWPNLDYLLPNGSSVVVQVSEETKGQPSMESFQLEFAGKPTASIPIAAKEEEIEAAVNHIFGYRCPADIGNPAFKKLFLDYEDGRRHYSGERVTNIAPYCGKTSLKNPDDVFSEGSNTIFLAQYKYLCFAYRGAWNNYIKIYYKYMDNENRESNHGFPHDLTTDPLDEQSRGWGYTCFNMYTAIAARHPSGNMFRVTKIRLERRNYAWVDVLYVGQRPTVWMPEYTSGSLKLEDLPEQILAPPSPNGQIVTSVAVERTGDAIKLTLTALECSHNFPLFKVRGGNVESGSDALGSVNATFGASNWGNAKVVTNRVSSATPPVAGTFDVTFKNETVTMPTHVEADEFRDIFMTLPTSGVVTITRSGTCSDRSYGITFETNTGDQPEIQIDSTGLTGINANSSVHTSRDGGVFLDPVGGDWLRTAHDTPQVSLMINNIPTKCSGDCSFVYSEAATPTVTAISPTEGSSSNNTELTINGTLFDTTPANNVVLIGGIVCDVTASTANQITCTIGNGPAGEADVEVRIEGKGNAVHVNETFLFTYQAYITDISPTSGSLAGGTVLSINGSGFAPSANVEIGGANCSVKSRSYSSIVCSTPPSVLAEDAKVQVIQASGAITSGTNFTYDQALTPTISSISSHIGSVVGGETIAIAGTLFGPSASGEDAVTVAGVAVTIESWNDTYISVTLPALPPGSYPLLVDVGDDGYADLNANSIPNILVTLEVNEISPLVGSLNGGTKITITGNGFTSNASKEILIGGANCEIESESMTEIVCVVGEPGQVYHVDNSGVHPIHGASYAWNPAIMEIMTGDSIHWSWKAPELITSVGYLVQETATSIAREYKPGGFSSGSAITPIGSFQHQFNTPGIYYYWSDFVDAQFSLIMRGTIRVLDRSKYYGQVSIKLNGIEADYNISQPEYETTADYVTTPTTVQSTTDEESTTAAEGSTTAIESTTNNTSHNATTVEVTTAMVTTAVSNTTNDTTEETTAAPEVTTAASSGHSRRKRSICSPVTGEVPGCNSTAPSSDSSGSTFNFQFTDCSTATISGISPNSGTSLADITITGNGFGPETCQNDVKIGNQPCVVSSASDTSIICRIDHGGIQQTGVAYPVSVSVNNRGEAANLISATLERSFALLPEVSSVSPSVGSTSGGLRLTVTGSGFSGSYGSTSVSIGGTDCPIDEVTYTAIICSTSASIETTGDVVVSVGSFTSTCEGTCTFQYSASVTPTVTDVSPTIVSGASTALTINGTNFGSNETGVVITVGETLCGVTAISSTSIICDLGYVTVGPQVFSLVVTNQGSALSEGYASLTSSALIYSVSPTEGSINGGTSITIAGNGFAPADTTVSVGGVDCTIETISISELTCITGAHSAGTVKININSNGIYYPQQDFNFSSSLTPVVDSVSPTSGGTGDSIIISGTGLNENATVTLGSMCVITSATATNITCTLGASSAGNYTINVDIPGIGLATSNIIFTYTLRADSISPSTGSFGGGQIVTVSGVGFDPTDVVVAVCNETCVVDKAGSNSTDVLCESPSSSGSGTQACDIIISSGSSSDTLTNGYTYNSANTPAVTSVSPDRGGTGGGLAISIAGTGFGSTNSDVNVTIAGTVCMVTSMTDTLIQCITGVHSAIESTNGDVNVTIAGTVCMVTSVTDTLIQCITGVHSPAIQTKVRVEIGTNGIATQDGADFWYIDVYSSPYSWGGNLPPVAGDFVVVPDSMTLLIDTDTPILSFLLILGGTVIFDDSRDIHLQAENILIMGGGSLQIGSVDNPYQHKAGITLHGHPRSPEYPIYGTKALAVREGTLELHGRPVSPTWSHLASTATAGSSSITLNDALSGWNVGDEIVIATTGGHMSQRENEKRTITAISGSILTLNTPLEFEHLGVTETFSDGTVIEFRAEVGLLSRSITVRGSNNPQWHDTIEACPDGFNPGEFVTQTCFQGRFGEEMGNDQFGAQIMIHAPEKDKKIAVAHISYAEVTYAGQAFRLGRYPVHFHLNGDMSGSYVKGCAIHETFNRAINVHGSHNLQIENNVVYNVMGGALFLEDGIETGNVFDHNLVVFCKQSTSLLNDDITPAAFWATNPNNTYINNTAVGGTHFGFWYRMHKHPDGPSFTNSICPQNVPLGLFKDNTVHSQGWFGIWIFQEYYPKKGGGCNSKEDEPAVFQTLTAWNCEKGSEAVTVGAIQFDGFRMVNNKLAGIEYKETFTPNKYTQKGALVKNSVIIGDSAESDSIGCTLNGIVLPFTPGFVVEDTKFVNFDSGSCSAFAVTRIDGKCKFRCGGWDYITHGLSFYDAPNKARFAWEHEGIIRDLDGTLTGTAGAQVTVNNGLLPSTCSVNSEFSVGMDGVICSDPAMKFMRFSFNQPLPRSLEAKDANFTNEFGSSAVPYLKKRLTHPFGWMVSLVSGYQYDMVFDNADQITNLTYNGKFYGLTNDEYAIILHSMHQAPDRFTVDPSGAFRNSSSTALTYSGNQLYDYRFDDNTNEFTYLITGKSQSKRSLDENTDYYGNEYWVKPKVYRCYFADCIEPIEPDLLPPSNERPAEFDVWSDGAYWAGGGRRKKRSLPVDGDDVEIRGGTWVVVDISTLPNINRLTIKGALEFDGNPDPTTGLVRDFTLNVTTIFIVRGRLIIGWPEKPYTGLCNIILNGNLETPDLVLPNGPVVGSKAIGVFGGLDLWGVERTVTWTTLAQTATAGTNQISLKDAVDWVAGEEIVIAATGFNSWETETFAITAKSADNLTLTLNSSLTFNHQGSAQTYGSYSVDLAAEVGLLSRNIKIIGDDYNKLYEESFGARILVGFFSQSGRAYTGWARISNVEFYRSGQEGYTEDYDPRYSLAFLNTGTNSELTPSLIRNNAFHHGFSPAIGVFGANGMPIENNVVHHTVGSAIRLTGTQHVLRKNLVTLMTWPGSYQDRSEPFNFYWDAGIEIFDAASVTMEGNHVAGSERSGYHIDGVPCSGGIESWKENVVHSSLFGIYILGETLPGTFSGSCLQITNFTIWRSVHAGVYIQQGINHVHISNVKLLDNTLGAGMLNIGPAALSHVGVEKSFTISDSLIVGTSDDFECSMTIPNDVNIALSSLASTGKTQTGGRQGLFWPSFMSSDNAAPTKKFLGLISYPALYGKVDVDGVTFANFGVNSCGQRDVVISTNPKNPDAQHPIYISNAVLVNVDDDSKVFIHRPSLGQINPSDCVDMECDAKKKALIDDLDGTYLGSVGAVIPKSELGWGEDRSRGIGDYRIPKAMLTDLDGNRIPVPDLAPNKGIIRDDTCVYKETWQAYECHGLDYEMMIIESLDGDTETRRLSPVALLGDGYMDLINGPADHGWCFGYTCQKRISTFYSLVATGKHYDLYFSSTTPQNLRFHLLNVDDTKTVRLAVYYKAPYRLDVYVGGVYFPPLNHDFNENGDMILKPPTSFDEYHPDIVNGSAGDNYVDRDWREIYVLIRGKAPVTIRQVSVLYVSFNVPALTIDAFFGENLISNLAALLKIDPSKIKIMEVISANSRKKRSIFRSKRAVGSDSITLEIGESPESELTDSDTPNPGDLTPSDLGEASTTIINAIQTGSIAKALNTSVSEIIVLEPVPDVSDDKWTEFDENEQVGSGTSYVKPAAMEYITALDSDYEFAPFPIQPEFIFKDAAGAVLPAVGSFSNPWRVSASLKSGTGDSNAVLLGETTARFIEGKATFADLAISHTGYGYQLEFVLTYPENLTDFNATSDAFDIATAPMSGNVTIPAVQVLSGEDIVMDIVLVDGNTLEAHGDPSWKGHTWSTNVSLSEYSAGVGTIDGADSSFVINATSGEATLNGISMTTSSPSRIFLDVHIRSSPEDYDFTIMVGPIDVMPADYQPIVFDTTKEVKLKFALDYEATIGGKEKFFIGAMWNHFMPIYYTNGTFVDWSVEEGSIVLIFNVQGIGAEMDNTILSGIYSEVRNGLDVTFDGDVLTASSSMSVDGASFTGGDQPVAATESPVTLIIIIVVVSVVIIVIIVVIIVFLKKLKSRKTKIGSISPLVRTSLRPVSSTKLPPYSSESKHDPEPSPRAPSRGSTDGICNKLSPAPSEVQIKDCEGKVSAPKVSGVRNRAMSSTSSGSSDSTLSSRMSTPSTTTNTSTENHNRKASKQPLKEDNAEPADKARMNQPWYKTEEPTLMGKHSVTDDVGPTQYKYIEDGGIDGDKEKHAMVKSSEAFKPNQTQITSIYDTDEMKL